MTDNRGELAYYGLTENDVVRLIGGVVVDRKTYLEVCEQHNNGLFMSARQQREVGEHLKKMWIQEFMLIRSMLLSSHPLYTNTNKGEK